MPKVIDRRTFSTDAAEQVLASAILGGKKELIEELQALADGAQLMSSREIGQSLHKLILKYQDPG